MHPILKSLFVVIFLKIIVWSQVIEEIYSPQNFFLDLEFQEKLENKCFKGSSKLHFVALESVKELVVQASVSEITTVDVWATNSSIYGHHNYSKNDGNLYISLTEKLVQSNAYHLLINFTGELRTDFTGFYIVPYLNEDMKTEYMMSTRFKPNFARTAFPCLDSPRFRSRLYLEVTHPAEFTAISNGMQNKVEEINNTTVKTKFDSTLLISSYQISLSLIKFESIKFFKGIEYAVHGQNEAYNSFALEASRLLLPQIFYYMKCVNQHGKLDILGIPTDMEITGDDSLDMAVFPEGDIEFSDSEQTVIEQIEVIIRIGRAVAHQYFGHHLTPATWADLWLSDGFANWLAYKAAEEIFSDLHVDQFFIVLEYQEALLVDSMDSSLPIRPFGSDDDSDGIPTYSPVLSAKSACIIRMLEHCFKKATFENVLKNYASDPKIVTSEIFLKEFEAETKVEVSLPGSWIYQNNYPLVEVERNYTDGTVHLTQTTFNAVISKYTWWTPFNIIAANNPDFESTNMHGSLNTEGVVSSSAVTWSNSDWIILNSQLTGFYRTNYDAENWKLLTDALLENHTAIHVNNRAQLLDDAFRLAQAEISPYELVLNLSIYLMNEAEFSPWGTADRLFSTIRWLLSEHDEQNLFRYYIRKITESPFMEMTLTEEKEDLPILKATRGIVTYWACQAWNANCFCRAKELYQNYINRNATIEPNIRKTVLCTGIGAASEKELEKTWKKLFRSNNGVERRETVFLLGCSQNERFLIDFLEQVFNADRPSDYYQHERKKVISKIIGKGKASVPAAIKFLRNSSYQEILNEESALLSALNHISQVIYTRNDSEMFRNLIQGMLDSRLLSKNDHDALSEKVEENLNSVQIHQDNILTWLRQFKERFPNNETETNGDQQPLCGSEPEPEVDCGCGCNCEGDTSNVILPFKLVYALMLSFHYIFTA